MCFNKTGNVNVKVFNVITGINESKSSVKRISYNRKCIFDGEKCNSNQKWNKGKCRCKYKKPVKQHV